MNILPAGTRNPLCPDAFLCDPALHVSVLPGIILVHRFQCSCINDLVFPKNLRFMDMSQSNIVKSRLFQPSPVEWYMLLIAAVRQQDLILLCACRPHCVIQRTGDLPAVVTHPVYSSPKLREVRILQLLPEEREHIRAPLKCTIV